MDGLELCVREAPLDDRRREPVLVVQEFLEVAERGSHFVRRRRDKPRVPEPRTADPVLGAAEFARRLMPPATILHEDTMRFANQAQRQRQLAAADALDPVLQGGDVARDFTNVVDGCARHAFCLVFEELTQR